MQDKFNELKAVLAEIADLNHAAAVLGWDQNTYMPRGAAESRGNQLATLGKISHEKFTSDRVGKLLDELKDAFPAESDEAAIVRVTRRDYDKATRVPPEFVVEQAQVTTAAHEGWMRARQQSDFSIFEPHLAKVLDLTKRYIGFFPKADHPYDTLLDDYEPGMKTAEVQAIFAELRKKQVKLLKAIAEKKQVDASFLYKKYPEAKQKAFGEKVVTAFGFNWDHYRQDKSPHPFTTSFSINDVRITTRYDEKFFNSAIFGSMHEAGHALYEGGIHPSFERTPLANGASLGVHESQSRMWENLVGRSFAFWEHFYPELQKTFPSQLGDVKLRAFYKGINKVEPSFIRVEADEATYNMHIILRFEIEQALIAGDLAPRDVPGVWNERFRAAFGIAVPDDARGCLQDIHWSGGGIGYFPTYTLGNLYAAQFMDRARADLSGLDDDFRAGRFARLKTWLNEKIHRPGMRWRSRALAEKVTGQALSHRPLIAYLKEKYAELFGV